MNERHDELHRLLLEIVERKIALRAYEYYQARGCAHGADLDDWLRAEQEVLGQSMTAPLVKRPLAGWDGSLLRSPRTASSSSSRRQMLG